MKVKKFILIIILFLSFLGIGSMLSNIQSNQADQLLEAYGLSNNTRYFKVQSKQTVSAFLRFLQKKYPKRKIQVHLASQHERNQTLIWSNHDVVTLPTENGRYFTRDDFKGKVSFAVLGQNARVKTLQVQNNQYVDLGNKYYTVIGTFKHYRQMKQNEYYLTTGPQQPTGRFKLQNYVIIIDSSVKISRQLAAHYGAKLKTPSFVKKHQNRKFSVVKEILLAIGLIIFAGSCNFFLALIDWETVKKTHLNGKLLRNWLVNRGIRMMLIELLLALAAYFFLCWRAFFSNTQHLLGLLLACWLLVSIAFTSSIFYLTRRSDPHA